MHQGAAVLRSVLFKLASRRLFGAVAASATAFAAGAIFAGVAMAAPDADDVNRSREPRQAAAEQPRPAPGQLRRLGGPTPVAGGIRPVGGDIRPVGGDIGITGGGIRPVGIGSPLANDRSFAGRLRPSTTAVGVSGYAIEPGWDDPPWGPSDVERPASSFGTGRTAGWESVSSAGFGPGVNTSGVADGAIDDSIGRRYVPSSTRERVWRVATHAPSRAQEPDATAADHDASTGDSADWIDPAPIPPLAARPRRNVRPDLRMAVRLSLEHQFHGAIDTLREAVYREPEAFNAAEGALFGDPEMQARVEQAIATYRAAPPGVAGVLPTDAAFMVAALEAASGRGDEAFAAIRHARELGEDRPSGKSLHRVLSRGRMTMPGAGSASLSHTPAVPSAPARP